MAMLPNTFVPEEAEEYSFEPIDAGWYPAEITVSKLTTTKDKKGKYLDFRFVVTDDEVGQNEEKNCKGRMVFTNLNIVNANATAVKIAYSDLKAICTAVGFEGELEDTEDLHHIPLMIKVTKKPETSQWPAKNEIKAFKSMDAWEEAFG